MKGKSLMKKVFVSIFLFVSCILNAQNLGDSVIMTVAGKPVSIGEFMFIAQKNNEVDFKDPKSIDSFINLFKNFKLKVKEAESLGLDTLDSYKSELIKYHSQLKKDYLSDKKAEEDVALKIYNRQKDVLDVSYILFKLPSITFPKDTITVFNDAYAIYERLMGGEDIDQLGQVLVQETSGGQVEFDRIYGFQPLQMPKNFEDVAYNMSQGEISKPIRTELGYYILKLNEKKANLGFVQVANIFIGFSNDSLSRKESEAYEAIQEAAQKIENGEDFWTVLNQYSDQDMKENNGILPYIRQGEVIKLIDDVAFSLDLAEVSKPIRTPLGYVLLKLVAKKDMLSFSDMKNEIIGSMAKTERNFELYKSFDEKLKREYNYVFYSDAYSELERLCDEVFPNDEAFFDKAKDMNKTLITINNENYSQGEFAYYLKRFPFSAKTYSGDFMQEIFDLFVRDIVTKLEEDNLESKYPEFNYLMQEYRDGVLLFEISNQKVWNHPVEEQPQIEQQWIRELEQKYPVVINRGLAKKIKKKK